MKTITAITPQVRNAARCNIFLDGEFFCGLSLEVVMKSRLKTGMQIEASEIESIQMESERSAALDMAMTYLSGALKTEKQTYDHLKAKGYTPAVCKYAVDKCREYGFLDDGYYAKRYAEAYSDKKGARLIAMELRAKGIERGAVDEAVSQIKDGESAAIAIAEKYMRGKEADAKTMQKLYRHLLSKGFSYDEAKAAADSLKAEEDD